MRDMLRPSQVAARTGTCPKTVVRWIQVGLLDMHGDRYRLQAERFARRYLVSPDALEAFLARMRGGNAVPAADGNVNPAVITGPVFDRLDKYLA